MKFQEQSVSRETFAKVIESMVEHGPHIQSEVRHKIGEDPGPGHLIDAALQLMATVEKCAFEGDLDKGMMAVSGALYLLRDLAIKQNYIVPFDKIQA